MLLNRKPYINLTYKIITMEELNQDRERIIKLCSQSSFRGNDLPDMRNLYVKYISPRLNVCLTCTGSVRHMANVFQQSEKLMLDKIDNLNKL